MSYKASQVTNSTGRHITLADMINVEKIDGTRKDPWAIRIEGGYKHGRIADLLSSENYDLLARYLTEEKGFPPHQECYYGKAGYIREVVVGSVEYRSNAYTIFHRGKEDI